MELASLISQLTQVFNHPFFKHPGFESQKRLAPHGRLNYMKTYSGTYTHSAVMILLFPNEKNEASFVLIQRSKDGSAHSGQIGLPGGKYEKEDKNLFQTAIRETKEEIGITIENEKVIGRLTPLKIPISGFEVTPIIAYTDSLPAFVKEEREVTAIYKLPVENLLTATVKDQTFIGTKKIEISAPYYEIDELEIWGATAMILTEFIDLLKA